MVKAAADKLKREMEEFGFPPTFPASKAEDAEEEKAAAAPKASESSKIDNKSKSKKVLADAQTIRCAIGNRSFTIEQSGGEERR